MSLQSLILYIGGCQSSVTVGNDTVNNSFFNGREPVCSLPYPLPVCSTRQIHPDAKVAVGCGRVDQLALHGLWCRTSNCLDHKRGGYLQLPLHFTKHQL